MRKQYPRIRLRTDTVWTVEQVLDARLRFARGEAGFRRMAQEFGAHRLTIEKAATGKSYRVLPMPPGPLWSVLR